MPVVVTLARARRLGGGALPADGSIALSERFDYLL